MGQAERFPAATLMIGREDWAEVKGDRGEAGLVTPWSDGNLPVVLQSSCPAMPFTRTTSWKPDVHPATTSTRYAGAVNRPHAAYPTRGTRTHHRPA